MSEQLGIILDNLLPSQANYYAQFNAHKVINSGLFKDITLFYIDKSSMMNQPKLSVCHVSHLTGFKGDVLATSIPSFLKLLKAPIYGKKYYYIWNMEWLMGDVVDAWQLYKLYRQEEIKYIARNKFHATLLINNFNRVPDMLMENFNLEVLRGQ